MMLNTHPIRIMVVDDHPVFREGLKQILSAMPDVEVCGEAKSGEEALELVTQVKPNLVILDIRLPGLDGIDCCRQIRERYPEIKVILLSFFGQHYLMQAIEAQAQACLSKEIAPEEMVHYIRAVYMGQVNLSQESPIPSKSASGSRGLTPRQQEMLRLVAAGESNRIIARQLHLSDTSVKRELRSIMDKLGAKNRAEAVSLAHFYALI